MTNNTACLFWYTHTQSTGCRRSNTYAGVLWQHIHMGGFVRIKCVHVVRTKTKGGDIWYPYGWFTLKHSVGHPNYPIDAHCRVGYGCDVTGRPFFFELFHGLQWSEKDDLRCKWWEDLKKLRNGGRHGGG